jgi:endo-1,4-beta-D-glucanase Y
LAWTILTVDAALAASPASPPLRPFPRHVVLPDWATLPSNVTRDQLDGQVERLYREWKQRYLRRIPGDAPQAYVAYNLEGDSTSKNAEACSEAQGYGLMATVLMAGADPQAHDDFDALLRFCRAHPSHHDPALMAWQQVKDAKGRVIDNPDGGSDSATDGDMDIAYALLLANRQWGSAGAIDYRFEASRAIEAIWNEEINVASKIPKLGDWASDDDPSLGPGTRPSDFMIDHLKAFGAATGRQDRWSVVVARVYKLIGQLHRDFSPSTGLLPDFVVTPGGIGRPAQPNYLEGPHDGDYGYNAARVPWRLAMDPLATGDQHAVPQLWTINRWIRQATGDDPNKIRAGYGLDGRPIRNYGDMAFMAPFAVSAMIDRQNKPWLDALWAAMVAAPTDAGSYYGNSIRLLCAIVVSGNWWQPL